MDAVILAAGLGTRLRPHTLKTPKPMLPVRGRPILDWTLGALPPAVDRVVVVVNYLAEQIEEYLRGQKRVPEWAVVRQEHPRGTGDALRGCRDHLRSDTFLTLNGDDLYGAADLAELARHPAGVLVHPVDAPCQFGVAFLKPDGTLEKLVEKPDLDGRRPANTGAYVFPRGLRPRADRVAARRVRDHPVRHGARAERHGSRRRGDVLAADRDGRGVAGGAGARFGCGDEGAVMMNSSRSCTVTGWNGRLGWRRCRTRRRNRGAAASVSGSSTLPEAAPAAEI